MFSRMVRGLLIGVMIFFIACDTTTTTNETDNNGDGDNTGVSVTESLDLSIDSITGIRSMAVGNGNIYLAGFVQDEDGIPYLKVIAIDGEGNPVTSYTGEANYFVNKIKYDSQEQKLFLAGSRPTGVNGYGFVMGVTASSLHFAWNYTFGSDIENRYYEVKDISVLDGRVYIAGYGSANYAILVRYIGGVGVDGTLGSGDILDYQPGGVNSSYDAITVLGDQVWAGGTSWEMDTDNQDVYSYGCFMGHFEGDRFYENAITEMSGTGKFCSGIMGLGTSDSGLVVIGSMADSMTYNILSTKPEIFVAMYDNGAFQGLYPVNVSEVAGMDLVINGYDVRDGKVLLAGYAHDDNTGDYYAVVVKVEYDSNTDSFEGRGSLVTNCTRDKGAKCEIYDVKFVDDTTFVVAGDLDYRGYVFSAKW